MNDAFLLGDHNVLCDRCGFKFKRSQCKKTWDGLIVCPKDWEPRHPLDTIKAKGERQNVKDARPMPELVFLATNEVTGDDL